MADTNQASTRWLARPIHSGPRTSSPRLNKETTPRSVATGGISSGVNANPLALLAPILMDTEILILDQPTHLVDDEAEQLNQEHLPRVTTDRTSFLMIHRLSIFRSADRILVLEDGITAEGGTPEQLMRAGGITGRSGMRTTVRGYRR